MRDKITVSGWRTPLVVIIAGCIISTTGFGVRSILGLFLEPMTTDLGWSRETFALAMAIQNLLWGAAVPVASAFADRFGAPKVLAIGAMVYFLGIWGMANAESTIELHVFAGLISGLGVALTAFSIVMATMAKVVTVEKRTLVLGLGTAAGSFGQVVFSPLGQLFINNFGWHNALVILATCTLIIIPLAFILPANPGVKGENHIEQGIGEAVREAGTHRGFILLTTGFFVCGFHVAFITVHFPAYIKDLGLAPEIGAWSIAVIGLFNILGSILSGLAGQKWSKKCGLAVIYFSRSLTILLLLMLPKTEWVILSFAAVMGILWLSTVPLTSGIVAQVFGVRYMATLFGIVFFSHQIGSFLGVWLGGKIYDRTGSYDGIWWAGIVLGVLATLVHLFINEKPLHRLQQQSSAS